MAGQPQTTHRRDVVQSIQRVHKIEDELLTNRKLSEGRAEGGRAGGRCWRREQRGDAVFIGFENEH